MEGYAVERDVRRMHISEPTCRVPTLPHRHTGKKVVMNGTHMLAAIVYSSVLALGVSGAAIAQDDTAKKAVQRGSLNVHQSADTRQGETEVTQGGSATQDLVVVPAMDRAPLMGMAVHNGQGKELGEVTDILATKDGSIDAIVVKSGGVLGLGETAVVVPWNHAQIASGQDGQTYVIVDV